ncbi:MAG: inositol monophosphatase [Myxococcota bacterium]
MSPKDRAALDAARERGLGRELATALAAARDAGAIVRDAWDAIAARPPDARAPAPRDASETPVTRADLAADAAIRARVAREHPDDGWCSEESGPRTGARTWIVDPLDGTHELLALVPELAVSIALVERGAPLVGVVANPIAGVVVAAVRGGGCFRDGARARVSTQCELARATALASRSESRRGDWEPIAGWFGAVRPTGSAAWKLAAVACGEGDLTVSVRPKRSWDVCAGDLLVREAGGIYADASLRAPRYAPPGCALPAGMAAGPRALVAALFARAGALAPGALAPGARAPDARERDTRERDGSEGAGTGTPRGGDV